MSIILYIHGQQKMTRTANAKRLFDGIVGLGKPAIQLK